MLLLWGMQVETPLVNTGAEFCGVSAFLFFVFRRWGVFFGGAFVQVGVDRGGGVLFKLVFFFLLFFFCRSEEVLGLEGEALRWFLYPWEGGGGRVGVDGDGRAGGTVAGGDGGSARCIIKPKVYAGVAGATSAAEAAAEAAVSTGGAAAAAEAERPSGDVCGEGANAAGSDGAVVAPAAMVGVGKEAAAGPAAGDGEGEGTPDALGGGGELPAAAAATAATAGGGAPTRGMSTPAPSPPACAGGAGYSEQASDRATATKPPKSEPDDSHKYPLRRASNNGAPGRGGFLSVAGAPPFLASANGASGASSSDNGAGGNPSAADPAGDGGGGGGGGASGKLKGYEGHMSALGKLGAGSAESRLFPKPGKKLLKVVGQAIQVCMYAQWCNFI